MVGPGLAPERRGTTALEFAILSVPFTLFLMFLFELGLDLYIQLALDYAVYQGARQLQTGAGNAAPSANVFKTDCLCPAVAGFLNCGQISLNVYPLSSTDYYQNAQTSSGSAPVVAGVLNLGNFTFVPSGSTTPMFLQATYTSVSTVGMLLPSMSVKSGTGRVHLTTSAIGFVNEPFTSSGTICGATS